MKIPMLQCQLRLMLVWVIGSIFLLLVAWLQIIFGHYDDKGRDVIEWLLPTVTPTLSLVVGVWANNTLSKSKTAEKIGQGIYRVVMTASIIYLAFIGLVFLIQPFVARPPIEVVKDSGLIIAPLQGVVCAFIGIFFTQDTKK